MTTTRVYSLRYIRFLFRKGGVYGQTLNILKREGIEPVKGFRDGNDYPADKVDEFIAMVQR